jgi:hypothetical protein
MTIEIEQARAAKTKLSQEFASLNEIVGIGLARSGASWVVKINLSRPIARGVLPEKVDGVDVLTEVVGQIDSR